MAAADYDWSHSPPSHNHSSPDTASPMYPDRLIRPLPKRRLRSRLSEEEAKSIEFPPAPPTVSPLFNLPYVEQSPSYANRVPRGDGDDHKCQCGADHGVGSDSAYADDYDGQNERAVRRGGSTNAEQDYVSWEQAGGFSKPPPPGSAASSADGYESFENTNNKKKRKIPLSGGSNHHNSSLSAEMVNMSISGSANDGALAEGAANGERSYYNTAAQSGTTSSSGTGISGAGRGRFGRPKHSLERRPLGASTNGVNAFASSYPGNGAKGKRDWGTGGAKDQGIISAAIANAAEEDDSLPPLEGSENISLLEQQAAKKAPPQTSQFTFSMDSESGRALYGAGGNPPPNAPPGTTYAPLPAHSKARAGAAYPPNTVPPAAAQQQQFQQHHTQQYQQHQQQPPPPGGGGHGGQGANQRPPRPRKPLSRLYQLAARQRKLQQEYQNYNSPPTSRDEIWVCEFCEYEAIFGTEPAALVRQYEEKDRKERKRAAEKRRLLEKAKMKGRKNRKAKGKNKGNNTQANNPANNPAGGNQHYDQGMDNLAPQGLDAQDEEFFDEEFDDEPIAQGAPPPPPTPTPTGYNVTQVNSGMNYPKASGGGYTGSSTVPQGQTRAPPASRTRKA